MRYYPVFAIGLISLLNLSTIQLWTKPVLAKPPVTRCLTETSKEKALIKKTKGKAIRQGTKLTIKTRQRQIVFQNNCNSEYVLTVAYELEAYFADVRYFLVRNVAVPHSEYTLVDDQTGTKTTLYGFPVFSPDRQRFTAMVIDEANGLKSIEIYRITATGLQQEYKDKAILTTTQPRWENNSTIRFQRKLTPNSPSISAILQIEKGVWKPN
jgi:hypothetical protein